MSSVHRFSTRCGTVAVGRPACFRSAVAGLLAAAALVLSASARAQERLPAPFDFIDLSAPGFRMHAGPEAWEAATAKLDEATRKAIGRRAASTYLLRTKEGGKSRALEVGLLMRRETGERVVWRQEIDFRTCTEREELRVHWGPDRSEYLKVLRTRGECPGKDEKALWEWAIALGQGKVRYRGTDFITAETASMRVSLTAEEWESSGHGEIAASLSEEFRKVFGEELVALSRVDESFSERCESVKGLFSLECGQPPEISLAQGPLLRWEIAPNCDFDASFGVPCSEEEKRLAELLRQRGRIH